MTPSNVLSFVLGATVAALTVFDMKVVEAFSTGSSKMTFQPARVVQGARLVASTMPSTKHRLVALSMSGEPGSSTTETTEGESKPMPTSGTYYDDEVDPIPKSKVGISSSMKERLLREASSGLDSEKKQTNVLLYIIGAVAVLVLLGGKDILF